MRRLRWGNVPRSQYFHLDRVPEWAERSIDQSKYRTYEGVRVYEASRSFGGQSFIPTWGGSVFETFAVPIMINEQKWGTNSWARSHPNMAKAQIQYGLDQFGYWGFSPATIPATGGYTEYGAPPLSVAGGYRPVGQRESTRAGPVVSPYSVLSLIEYEPEAVMDAMRKLITNFPALDHPTYGLMDSVDVQTGIVSNCALYLDNSLALGAVANYLTDGKLRGYVDRNGPHPPAAAGDRGIQHPGAALVRQPYPVANEKRRAVPYRTARRFIAYRRLAGNQATFLSKNCSSSVEPFSAVVDDWPPSMACVTASK